MKTCPVTLRLTTVCLAALLVPLEGRAEEPRPPRGDVAVSLGWLHADTSALSDYSDDWASQRLTLGGQAGYYWTEHLRTEISAERSSSQHVWGSEEVRLPDGRLAFRQAEHQVQDTRVAVGQFYQFGHNSWTHALVGGGLSLTRRRTESSVSPLQRYDSRGMEMVDQGSTRSSTDVRQNAFLTAAVKAYMTPRVFFRSDFQADFRTNIDAIVLRAGIGVDF